MLRAAWLIFLNEFRLLTKDRVGLAMLILAPVVIIAVAGFSLGNIYGVRPAVNAYDLPIVDQDHGAAARAIITALSRDPAVHLERAQSVAGVRALVGRRSRVPLAIVIPAGITAALEAGRPAELVLYVDPIKRIEVAAIELRLSRMCTEITARAQDNARTRISAANAELRVRLERLATLATTARSAAEHFRRESLSRRDAAQRELDARLRSATAELAAQTRVAAERSAAAANSELERELAPRRDAMNAVRVYLSALQASERDFNRWLANLKAAAGSHSADIPPPPAFPRPPTPAQLAVLSKPIEISPPATALPEPALPNLSLASLPTPSVAIPDFDAEFKPLLAAPAPTLPGALGWTELSAGRGPAQANAFDQYVPGFGVTFLLIGMMMGISLGLIDERDWGTLARLRASGAPFAGTLLGKLLSRFVIGLMQMALLFAIGRWLFAISLGSEPLLLLIPSAAIAFAAAAFGLIIACIARTHDSVMPFGTVVSMAMSAIGGCWWPMDFEPGWMRAFAQWLPTTWTMQSFNDLMIRNLPASAIVWPTVATVGLGIAYLIVGIVAASWIYD
ncbi:MAG TPA: ABC transporter permease [Candidatus Binataceae bacterium]|nr:ABC transporter permease [Candidatus Binataceae bacterium]